MVKNKKGFISMTLVYTFLIIFMFLMLAILRTYQEKDKFLEAINSQIDSDISVNNGTRALVINKLLEDNTPQPIGMLHLFNAANNGLGNGNGLFYMDSDDLTDENSDGHTSRIYFFRGTVENNYALYNGMCFRILRTNEDGSIRLLFDGLTSTSNCNKTSVKDIGTSSYYCVDRTNDGFACDAPNHVDYVKVEEGASSIPTADENNDQSNIIKYLNDWYATHFLVTKTNGTNEYFSNDVSKNSIFCNDKSIYGTNAGVNYFGSKGLVPRFKDPTNRNIYDFNAITNDVSLKCSSSTDRFSVLDQSLQYPVGLLTAQEVVLAGGYLTSDDDEYNGGASLITNESYFLYYEKDYWTMSPYSFESSTDTAKVVYVDTQGTLRGGNVNDKKAIRPVISLNSNISIESGQGTRSKPYILK